MPKASEILSDSTKYPDATEWTLPDGTKTTVGEIRADMKSAFVPAGDMTRSQQKAADERRQLEQNYQVELYKVQQAAEQLKQQLAKAGQSTVNTPDDLDAYLTDNTFGPLARKLKAALDRTDAMQKSLDEQKQQMANYEQTWWLDRHAQVIRRIQSVDADMKDQGKITEFLNYAKTNQLNNLDTAYALYTRDRDIERAKETASKEAYERAKQELAAPKVPTGANQNGSTTTPLTQTPTSLDDAENLAKADPEIARLMESVA